MLHSLGDTSKYGNPKTRFMYSKYGNPKTKFMYNKLKHQSRVSLKTNLHSVCFIYSYTLFASTFKQLANIFNHRVFFNC